ncbi:hypothetical protein K470DRAFT_217916 [Piedraia hortae CBS 480.64]|uniref:Increased recombination centers protein 6 n=1 Tax=Piedraia hortae CBS 480.64 TaxID=1314780 RepID=A0A6A7BZ30_9PEZI|nr:hypothetical protein K470DRAFT_217916 [Piedraia hortae CBS 480.64]
MDIQNCRRLLCVAAPGSRVLDVIQGLTGKRPALNDEGTTAGLLHEWRVETAYYKATVPVWVDEIANVDEWKAEFLKSEAKEVVEALSAWVYCFGQRDKEAERTMAAIAEVVKHHSVADQILLAVQVPGDGDTEKWEDICLEHGFEYIAHDSTGKNEFGEKIGAERLREALETTEWTADEAADEPDFDFDFLEGESPDEQSAQVDDIERMRDSLLAVREQAAGLPEAERKKMAARAVSQLMTK